MYSIVIKYDAVEKSIDIADLNTDVKATYMLSNVDGEPGRFEKALTLTDITGVKDIEALVDPVLMNTATTMAFEIKKDGVVVKSSEVASIRYLFGLDDQDQLVERVTCVAK